MKWYYKLILAIKAGCLVSFLLIHNNFTKIVLFEFTMILSIIFACKILLTLKKHLRK